MKKFQWICGLWCILSVLLVGVVSAGTVTLNVPDTNKDGVVENYSGYYPDATSNVMYVGNYWGVAGTDFHGVYKFDVDSVLTGETITSAKLYVFCNDMVQDAGVNAAGVGIKLQHYTAENSTNIEAADYTKAVEDVTSLDVSATGWIELDVTSAVSADVAAGFGSTSFTFVPTDGASTVHYVRLAELSYNPGAQAYIVVTYGGSTGTQLASWPVEFSSTQGVDNWYYLHAINFDYHADEATNQMTVSGDGTSYSGGDGGATISSSGIWLPGEVYNTASGLRTMAILRWVSEVDSDIRLTGSFQRTRGILPSGTFDGVTAYICVNGVQKWVASMPETDETEHTFDFAISGIKAGDDIDFKLFPVWHNWADETAFNVTISTALNAPTFSPSGTYISSSTPVVINASTPTSVIYYTTDGSDPTTSSDLYTGPVTVTDGMTLKAIAVDNSESSAITSQTYIVSDTILASWPTEFNSEQGFGSWYYLYALNFDYYDDEMIAMLSWDPSSSKYLGSDGLYVESGMILPGDLYQDGMKYSAVLRWVSDVATDLTITGAFQKKVSTSDPAIDGVTVFVRCNGEDQWSEYLSNVDVDSHSFTVRLPRVEVGDDIDFVVYSYYHNWADETYLNATVEVAATMAPDFSVTDEYISGPTPVAIASVTPGAVIYYTTDGTEPTTASTLYTGPVTITTETMLKAIAVAGGEPSGITSQQYYSTSHGRRVILDRGLQIQALVNPVIMNTTTDIDIWEASNFTTFMFWHSGTDNNPALLAELWARDLPWSRESFIAEVVTSWEIAYLDNFVNMQYQDELDQTPEVMEAERVWVENMNNSYPNALAYTNFLPNVNASTIATYMQTVKPDMIMFDYYPRFEFTEANRNGWYSIMQRYRVAGLAGNDGTGRWPIPYAQWLETYRSDASNPMPTEAFLRVQQFASWTFGFTFVEAFMYNDSGHAVVAPVLFDPSTGAQTAAFYQIAEANRQSRNLGPALVRLVSSDLRMIMGKDSIGVTNYTPVGITAGIAGADSYLTNVTVTNLGSRNGGEPGDVILGFFNPLDEAYDGDTYSGQTYFMVTNGLVDSAGTPAQLQQNVRLTFDFGTSGITSLQRLSRDTGMIETVALTNVSGSVYYLDLVLDGGTGDLFKYNTGAPFVGVTEVAPMPGDANNDGAVDVGDLGILAANYGTTSGATWGQGDFNGDGAVDVGDLGILAANYGSGSSSADFDADYAKVFGNEADAEDEAVESLCSVLGLPLIAGLLLVGLMLVKLEE